jgi:hypothetical protein
MSMDLRTLDFICPFIIFGHGLIMTLVLNQPHLMRLAEERLPLETCQRFKATRLLGLTNLFIGGLWSLQNLWFK